jgi:hypothetical protein
MAKLAGGAAGRGTVPADSGIGTVPTNASSSVVLRQLRRSSSAGVQAEPVASTSAEPLLSAVPPPIPTARTFAAVVSQWTIASVALPVPLSAWPERWRVHNTAAQTYLNRRRIWDAYVACGKDAKIYTTKHGSGTLDKQLKSIAGGLDVRKRKKRVC